MERGGTRRGIFIYWLINTIEALRESHRTQQDGNRRRPQRQSFRRIEGHDNPIHAESDRDTKKGRCHIAPSIPYAAFIKLIKRERKQQCGRDDGETETEQPKARYAQRNRLRNDQRAIRCSRSNKKPRRR